MATGYVYVLSNASMQGLLKIGYTCSSVEKRARELSSVSGVPSAFVVEYFHISDDAEEVEALVHDGLESARVADGREFFFTSVSEAIRVIEQVIRKPTMVFRRIPDVTEVATVGGCRRCGFAYERSPSNPFCPKCGY